jgi:formimidoylglutamate deiminase
VVRVKTFLLDHALLPTGWATDVGLDVEDGIIRAVTPGVSPAGRDRVAGIALPGLPNLHCHSFQRAMAGLAETRGPADDSFWTWRQVMYRFLGALTPDDIEAIAAFAFMEMLEAGFTSVVEFHYLHHDRGGAPYADLAETSLRTMAAARETGIGLTLLPSFYANGTFGDAAPLAGQRRFINDPDRFLRLVEAAQRGLASLPGSAIGIAPHSLRAVTPASLAVVVASAPPGPIHIHAAEQAKEVEDCIAWSGLRPVEWLLANQEIGPRWCLIHATHMLPAETMALAASGAVAGLCPLTEASLGDGTFDGVRYLDAGGRFGLGTDSNIEITAAGELKQLEYGQRLWHLGRNVLARVQGESSGRRLYERALTGGAQASGRAIGALAPGRRADFVVLDADHPDLVAGTGDRWLDAYVFVAGKAAVDSVFVAGDREVQAGAHRLRPALTARYKAVMRRLAAD